MFNTKSALKMIIILTTFAAATFSGCDLSLLGMRDTTKGALSVSINSSRFSESRSILPEAEMTPAEYIITGTGPDGETFERTSTGTDINVYDLAVGSWTIAISAHNADSQQIGWGESIVFVSASMVSEASVLVEPYTGKGSVAFSATWDDADVSSPAVSAVMTDAAGTETTLPFNVGSGSAVYTSEDISAGYYTLNIKLLDGSTAVSGLVESVRVLQDFQTSGDFNFTDLNNPSGDISITVIVNMYEPFEPVISGAVDTLAYGSNMTVSAAVPDSDGETLNYSWFANGDLVGSTETITFGSALRWGSYRLDLVVTNDDGSRSGSATHSFTVE